MARDEMLGSSRAPHIGMAWCDEPMREADQPSWVSTSTASYAGFTIAARARVDNRDDLIALLEPPYGKAVTDAELFARLLVRYDIDAFDHVAGDFAVVAWDATRTRVIAACDPFAVRRLFYSRTPEGIVFASTPEALLEARDPDEWRINSEAVVDFLVGHPRIDEVTFFADVLRVMPGQVVIATGSATARHRYFNPPSREVRLASRADYEAGFRALFERAVRRRLAGRGRVLAQLSGGLDSSSVAVVAHALISRGCVTDRSLETFSMTYPGSSADERPYIQLLNDRIGCPSHSWNAMVPHPEARGAEGWSDPLVPQQRSGDFECAEAIGSRSILTGHFGDQLLFEAGLHRDLGRSAQWGRAIHEAVLPRAFYAARPRSYFAAEVARGAIMASPLRTVYETARRVRDGRRTLTPPRWLHPNWESTWRAGQPRDEPAVDGWLSESQRLTWRSLTHPFSVGMTEQAALRGDRRGIEYRFPFLDRDLVEFVLAIPFEFRQPEGRMKGLLRGALADLLPAEVAANTQCTIFDSTVRALIGDDVGKLGEFLGGLDFHCAAYVDRTVIRSLIEEYDAHSHSSRNAANVLFLRRIYLVENWLRLVCSRRSQAGRTVVVRNR